ncbi:hypothetical protein ACMYR2_2371 [Nitrobacter sp. TKz-YC01]
MNVSDYLLRSAISASEDIPEHSRPEFLKFLSDQHRLAADLIAKASVDAERCGRVLS